MAFDFPSSPTLGQTSNGYTWDGEKWLVSSALAVLTPPTFQSITVTGTYTKPAAATWIEVFMVGGGGGGGGGSSGSGGGYVAGSDGTATSFGGIVASAGGGSKGAGSVTQGAIGGAGGFGGAGTATRRARGGPGGGGGSVITTNPTGYTQGGQGGSSYFSGGTQVDPTAGSVVRNGVAGDPNSGAGGSAGSSTANSNFTIGGGGGGGEFVYLSISSPAATYACVIGPGGAGGAGGNSSGGTGGSGFIFVVEHYDAVGSSGGGGGAKVSTSSSPPSSPADGDLWWEDDTGRMFMFYDDGTGAGQWVQIPGGNVPATPVAAIAKAWARITQSGGVYSVVAGYNIASVTKNSTGNVTVNFTTPFASADYAVAISTASGGTANTANYAAGSFRVIIIVTVGGAAVDSHFDIVCFGNQ